MSGNSDSPSTKGGSDFDYDKYLTRFPMVFEMLFAAAASDDREIHPQVVHVYHSQRQHTQTFSFENDLTKDLAAEVIRVRVDAGRRTRDPVRVVAFVCEAWAATVANDEEAAALVGRVAESPKREEVLVVRVETDRGDRVSIQYPILHSKDGPRTLGTPKRFSDATAQGRFCGFFNPPDDKE